MKKTNKQEIEAIKKQRDEALEKWKTERKFYCSSQDEVLRLTFENRSLQQENDLLRDRLQTIASVYYENKKKKENFKKMEDYYSSHFEENLERALPISDRNID
jgi:hypothetical protein